MLKPQKLYPYIRPSSRLDNPICRKENKAKIAGVNQRRKSRSPRMKRKFSGKSPTKQNKNSNILRLKSIKATPTEILKLPEIHSHKQYSQPYDNAKHPMTDFESYCAEGHPVFVDERDAGVKLGNLNRDLEDSEKKLNDLKQHIGETAYVPYNLDVLKRKVDQKLHTAEEFFSFQNKKLRH